MLYTALLFSNTVQLHKKDFAKGGIYTKRDCKCDLKLHQYPIYERVFTLQ